MVHDLEQAVGIVNRTLEKDRDDTDRLGAVIERCSGKAANSHLLKHVIMRKFLGDAVFKNQCSRLDYPGAGRALDRIAEIAADPALGGNVQRPHLPVSRIDSPEIDAVRVEKIGDQADEG